MAVMKKYLSFVCTAAFFTLCAWTEPDKKLIFCGWGVPFELEQFQIPAEKFEKYTPFDGIGIRPHFKIRRNGKTITYYASEHDHKSPLRLKKEDFKEWIAAFDKLKFKKLKNNFLMLTTAQFSPDWFDDAAWEKAIHNHKTLAWLAKRIGFKGLIFDTEGYPKTGRPLAFRPQLGKSFAETEAKVRERGAQWIKAIAEEYPDITLFCYIWSSDVYGLRYSQKKADTVTETLALQRAFMNGVYDAIPETVRIIDGNENFGYHCATEADFDKVAADFRYYPRRIIAKENLGKYYKHTSMAFALYLDSYMPGNRAPYDIWTKAGGNQARLLNRNIERSFARADEYVWIWAERGTFFPQLYSRYPHWDKRLKHTTAAILAGKSPVEAAKKYAGSNLLKNSQMKTSHGGVSGWFSWKEGGKKAPGILKGENDTAVITGVTNGSFNQHYRNVKAGERYLLTAKVKVKGDFLIPTLRCTLYGHDGRGMRRSPSTVFASPGKDGWRHAALLVDIPEDGSVKFITPGIAARSPRTGIDEKSICIFDDVELKKITYPWDKK